MKNILVLLLAILVGLELEAQSDDDILKNSWEFSFGISKAEFRGENDFIVGGIYCLDCDLIIVSNSGQEFNSKLTFNKPLNIGNEIVFGFGLNLWSYKVDEIDGGTGISVENQVEVTGLFDIILGYRYVIKEFSGKSLFVENMFHGELNFNNDFNKFKFSLEPGLGMNIKMNEGLKFLTVISYKQSLTDFSILKHTKHIPYNFGVRLGLNVTL